MGLFTWVTRDKELGLGYDAPLGHSTFRQFLQSRSFFAVHLRTDRGIGQSCKTYIKKVAVRVQHVRKAEHLKLGGESYTVAFVITCVYRPTDKATTFAAMHFPRLCMSGGQISSRHVHS